MLLFLRQSLKKTRYSVTGITSLGVDRLPPYFASFQLSTNNNHYSALTLVLIITKKKKTNSFRAGAGVNYWTLYPQDVRQGRWRRQIRGRGVKPGSRATGHVAGHTDGRAVATGAAQVATVRQVPPADAGQPGCRGRPTSGLGAFVPPATDQCGPGVVPARGFARISGNPSAVRRRPASRQAACVASPVPIRRATTGGFSTAAATATVAFRPQSRHAL